MKFGLILLLLLSLSCFITHSHPWGDLSHRHRRSDVNDEDTGKECYFSKASRDGKVERPSFSKVSDKCAGKLTKMSDLMGVKVNNLYQSPNYVALFLERGDGRFDIDWSDQSQVDAIGKNVICSRHEAELGRNWHSNFYHHFLQKLRPHSKITDYICSMPPPFTQHEEPVVLHNEIHHIEADEARAILKLKNVLLHPGLPVCAAHNEEAKEILSQYMNQLKGHAIRPHPLGGELVSHVTHSDTRDKNDPNYFLHHPENNLAPINTVFVNPPNFSRDVKNAYVTFMKSLGLDSSIAHQEPWHGLDPRSQRRKTEIYSIATNAIAHFIAPQDPAALQAKAFKGAVPHERSRPKEFVEMMTHAKNAFVYAGSKPEKIAALSTISNLHLSEIHEYLPGLTSYYLNEARKYARRGYHLIKFHIRRVRYNLRKENRALEYITSFKTTLNAPYGTRKVRDSYGKYIEIPNMIRTMRVGEMFYGYKQDLAATNEMDLLIPESTFRKILRVCKAERRKSLHGVDIMIADAMESFDRADHALEKMQSSNWISKRWHDSLRSEMLASRQYLRTDFLAHAKEFSTTGDHCWSFGLSDPDDIDLQVDCQKASATWTHSHPLVCDQCENLHVWLNDMRDTLKQLLEQHKNDKQITQEIAMLQRDFSDWEIKIEKLKAHQLRTAKSENDRQWLAAGLKPGDVLLTLDWAMKLLKLQPRQSTADWYGQRGMPWHIGHALTFRDGEFVQHNYVHLFEGERQDSAAVTAIIRSIFRRLASRAQRVFLRSDQAGCYKSAATLSSVKAIADDEEIELVGWYFSEAQAGKGPADRSAATLKGYVRGYVDSGHPVTNAEEFFEGLTHEGRIYDGYSFHVVRLEGTEDDKKPRLSPSKIPDLHKYNAFTFEEDFIRMHRYWNIGKGKTIPYDDLIANDAILVEEKVGGATYGDAYWLKLGEPRKRTYVERITATPASEAEDYKEIDEDGEGEDEDSVCMKNTETKECKEKKQLISTLYKCPVESCSREFLSEKNLEKHLTVGKHLRRPERLNVKDYALHSFTSFVEAVFPPRICPVVDEATSSLMNDNANGVQQKMGWALVKRRRSKRFPKTVKEFLKRLYDAGETTGAHTDARGAEQLMREATKPGGGMLFELDDLLTTRQIAGVYSGFKTTKLDKRDKVGKRQYKKKKLSDDEEEEEMEVDEEEIDEVNQLFETDGDEELEYDTEPLFDEQEAMRRAIDDAKKKKKIYADDDNGEDEDDEEDGDVDMEDDEAMEE